MTEDAERVRHIAELAVELKVTVATSESLTSGTIATTLGAGPDAADWFTGGIVAYQAAVKFATLGLPEGPVVTAESAAQMAEGARKLLGADIVVSATGVGGPHPSEGKPAGTVFIAVATPNDATVRQLALGGDPGAILAQTTSKSLELLEEILQTD